ncbi:MAG TPA: BON domain-containing protein [Vicinamibacterales bacterium]|nr:BON domain-containing protein [Vicinamibacterales bacterium]
MRTPQLLWTTVIAGIVAVAAACNRTDTAADARRAAAEVKKVAARAGDQLADSWLTTKIQAQYFADDDIKARYINVSTRDGVVTLSGRVKSADAKQQALQIAQNTDGVRQVQDHLVIGLEQARDRSSVPEQMDAAWITTKIQAKYFADPSVNGRDINVTTTNGVVTLSGRVDSEQTRQQAIAIARGTDGVARVEDRLAVQPEGAVATTGAAGGNTGRTLGEKIDDARITSTIQSKYFLDDLVKGRRINVDTRQGVVTLRGDVGNESERAQALLLARNTDGVQRVEDNLTVNPAVTASTSATADNAPPIAERADDAQLTTKIQSKFFLDSQVKAGSIDVSSKDGVVLLEGTVPNEAARKKAVSVARSTDGVVQVIDRLKVAARKK